MKRISEYVSLGHPDKTADYISQYLLDRYIDKDPDTRYAVEVQIKDNHVTLGGEITSKANFKPSEIVDFVRMAVRDIGYTKEYAERWNGQCICGPDLQVTLHISQQSHDIARGRAGWGDQGIFFGYAEYGSADMMPKDYYLAKTIGTKLYARAKALPELGWGLDIKTQVVMPEDSDRPEKVIVAVPVMYPDGAEDVRDYVKVLLGWTPEDGPELPCEIIVNGTGAYTIHSAVADCGTTGRKLAVDFYGGNCRIGGGAPWTKDASKADLTLNLFARALAVHYASLMQKTVTVSLASCIGQTAVDFCIYDEHGETIEEGVKDVDPALLRKVYHLDQPIYAEMCSCGLFGSSFEWDKEAAL